MSLVKSPYFFSAPTVKLFEKAIDLIILTAKESVHRNGKFVIALSGGKTPEALYDLFAQKPYCDEMPWDKTYIFWGDERHVPENDPQNNAFMAKGMLINKVSIPPDHVYPVPVNLIPEEAAKAYEKLIIGFFGNDPLSFDIILLGLGTDGHTASLFPGNSVINEKLPGIRDVFQPEKNAYRITMTAPLINMAKNILFLVTGTGKAKILSTIFSSACDPKRYPACLIKPVNGNLHWFADLDAANLIRSRN